MFSRNKGDKLRCIQFSEYIFSHLDIFLLFYINFIKKFTLWTIFIPETESLVPGFVADYSSSRLGKMFTRKKKLLLDDSMIIINSILYMHILCFKKHNFRLLKIKLKRFCLFFVSKIWTIKVGNFGFCLLYN